MVQTASAASVGPADPGSKLGGRLFFVTILHGTVLALRVACGVAAWIADLNLLGVLRALSRLSAFVLAFVHCLALRVACGVAAWRAVLNLLDVLRALSCLSAFVLAFLGESGAMFSLVFHMQMKFCGGATDSIFCAR